MNPNYNQNYNQFGGNFNQYQPVFKQIATGSGIDNNEFTTITNACSKAYVSKMTPLSTSSVNLIKQAIGGEWFICCSPTGTKDFDFCISTVSGGDFLSFCLDNITFHVCRIV